MGDLDDAEDYWLEGGVEAVTMGAENGFPQEVDRIIEFLGADGSWLAWWRRISAVDGELAGADRRRVSASQQKDLADHRAQSLISHSPLRQHRQVEAQSAPRRQATSSAGPKGVLEPVP